MILPQFQGHCGLFTAPTPTHHPSTSGMACFCLFISVSSWMSALALQLEHKQREHLCSDYLLFFP